MLILSLMDTITRQILDQAKAFCDRQGITQAQLSMDIFGHKAFFRRLDKGRGCHIGSYAKVQAHFASHGYDPDKRARDGAEA